MQAWSKISRMPAQAIRKMQDELLQKMISEELVVRHPSLPKSSDTRPLRIWPKW